MSTELFVHLKRESDSLEEELVQVHALQGKTVLSSQNIIFPKGKDSMGVTVYLPPFELGQELVTIHLLATDKEQDLSDNKYQAKGDTVWFFTDNKSRADKKIFWESNKYNADLKVFETDNKYQTKGSF